MGFHAGRSHWRTFASYVSTSFDIGVPPQLLTGTCTWQDAERTQACCRSTPRSAKHGVRTSNITHLYRCTQERADKYSVRLMRLWCVFDIRVLCREQPQFEFLELPNQYTSKLWQDGPSSNESDTETTAPSAEVATPPSSAARIKGHRDALRGAAQAQTVKVTTNTESAKSLLSVESAIRRAGIQVSVDNSRAARDAGQALTRLPRCLPMLTAA